MVRPHLADDFAASRERMEAFAADDNGRAKVSVRMCSH